MKRKTGLKKLHFWLIAFLLLHFLFSLLNGFQISAFLLFWPKTITFLSGIYLFFAYWKDRSKLTYYFGVYVFTPLIVLVGWLVDGILGAILGSFFFVFFHVPEQVISNGNVRV